MLVICWDVDGLMEERIIFKLAIFTKISLKYFNPVELKKAD